VVEAAEEVVWEESLAVQSLLRGQWSGGTIGASYHWWGNPVARLRLPALRTSSWCRRGTGMRRSFWPDQIARGGSLVTGEAAAILEQSSEACGRMREGKSEMGDGSLG
jgi:hypothetical protein